MTTNFIDINGAGNLDSGIFGLPFSYENARVIYMPIPWEATTSYGKGTMHGPSAIIDASVQLDLLDLDVKDPYLQGLYSLPISEELLKLNDEAMKLALPIKEALGNVTDNPELKKNLKEVNAKSDTVNQIVYNQTLKILEDGKIPALIGGDHSSPFGAFLAASKIHSSFGILHFDAHSDTRKHYLGFTHSHASIMYNAATLIPQISKFVQVGIRDFCEDEYLFTKSEGDRFQVYYDNHLKNLKSDGKSFTQIANEIVSKLPEKVWVSFDIDGLDPRFCPHTGTPVPGGLDYYEAIMILRLLSKSGRKIIGFDVVEVAPKLDSDLKPIEVNQANDEWDANVGMRLIYKLSALSLASQGFSKFQEL